MLEKRTIFGGKKIKNTEVSQVTEANLRMRTVLRKHSHAQEAFHTAGSVFALEA